LECQLHQPHVILFPLQSLHNGKSIHKDRSNSENSPQLFRVLIIAYIILSSSTIPLKFYMIGGLPKEKGKEKEMTRVL
jgi:hypothetical protein